MAELQLLSRLAGDPGDWSTELARIPAALRHLIGDLPARIEAWTAGSFSGRESVVVLGSGPWRPAAMYGAAKFLEMAVPSRHQCMEEFNHLEVFLTGAETLVVFLCPDGPSLSRTVELVAPFERLGAQRLCLVASHLAGSVPASTLDGADILSVPCGGAEDGAGGAGGNRGVSAPSLFFAFAVALQFLAASIGPALGRDIDRWVGGVRTGLIEDLSQTTIRRSRIRDDDAFF
jgi:glucosamine 6-phosphate synthetase-like amidotransferase/phosphosugar isomerase protein